MVLAVTLDDVKTHHVRIEGNGKGSIGGVTQIPFLSPHGDQDVPHASLNRYDAGRISRSHFHIADQFQVVVNGKGKLGRHDFAPYTLHFSRAFTPYGPLMADASTALTFFVMRAHPDAGSQRLPDKLDKLKRVPHRQPWQITSTADFTAAPAGAATEDVILQAIPGMHDERGLAGYTLRMKPHSQFSTPDPASGDGQYLVLLHGSLWRNDKEHKAWALLFSAPGDGPLEIRSGAEGLEALVLNFPRPLLPSQFRIKEWN